MSPYGRNTYTFWRILYVFSPLIKIYYPSIYLLEEGLDGGKTAQNLHLVPAVY